MTGSSTSDFAVETVIDLLDGESSTTWTDGKPEINQLQEVAPKARKGIDRGLFVWSPVESNFDRFSADGDHLDQDDTVETICATYDKTQTARLLEDVVDILSQYMDDNESQTNFRNVQPTQASDDRGLKILRTTEHYEGSVTVSLEAFRDTGT